MIVYFTGSTETELLPSTLSAIPDVEVMVDADLEGTVLGENHYQTILTSDVVVLCMGHLSVLSSLQAGLIVGISMAFGRDVLVFDQTLDSNTGEPHPNYFSFPGYYQFNTVESLINHLKETHD